MIIESCPFKDRKTRRNRSVTMLILCQGENVYFRGRRPKLNETPSCQPQSPSVGPDPPQTEPSTNTQV